jgi:hypothetical protein
MQIVPGLMQPDAKRRALILADSLGRLDFPHTAARVERKGTVRPKP